MEQSPVGSNSQHTQVWGWHQKFDLLIDRPRETIVRMELNNKKQLTNQLRHSGGKSLSQRCQHQALRLRGLGQFRHPLGKKIYKRSTQ